ncbi:MAG: cell wall hydrolase [Lachnospiraceae bacterium]|nr:cell wall hydrolase [Lachnospiraceae bacterium]
MLKIVQAEAGGCDSTGKILVANVIMNRVEDSSFPDDITSVVYERSQFTPVSSGAIDRVQVTKETVECVDRALQGEDPSQGALYFMNRKASGENAQWFDRKLTFLFSHDGHEFFK